MFKRLLTVLLVMLMSISFVFAQGSGETSDNGEVKEISIFHFKSLWLDPWEELMDIYEEQTGVKVNSEITGGNSDHKTMLKTKIAADEIPDMFFINGYSEYQLFKDYVAPQNGAGWLENVADFAKDGVMVNGKVIGMPLTVESYGILYNKDLFKQAGIDKVPETFEELEVACEKLKAIGVTPFSTGFGTGWVVGQHFANTPFSKRDNVMGYVDALKAGSANLADDPVMKNWKNIFDLVLANCTPNPLSEDHQTEVSLFAQGKSAMMLQGNWKENSVMKINPDMNMGIMGLPIGPGDKYAANITNGIPFFIAINAKASPAVQEACKSFLTWLVNEPIAQQYVVEKFQAIPAFTNFELNNLSPVATDIARYMKEGKVNMWAFPLFPDGCTEDFVIPTQEYVGGKISFDEMLNKMADIMALRGQQI